MVNHRINLKETKKGPMPHNITPMMARIAPAPFDDGSWIFEPKWDGYRAIAQIENGDVFLYSRNHIRFNERFPELVNELNKFKYDIVLDGEIVVVDNKGVPHFQYIQDYKVTGKGQLIYYIFDIIYLDGFLLESEPLWKRKEILQNAIPASPLIKYSEHIEKDGKKFFEAAKDADLEGIMAKQKDSPYLQKRSGEWLKIKAKNRQEAVIAGYTAPRKSRGGFGALILGVYQDNGLIYIGHVGTGFSKLTINELMKKMKPLVQEDSPFGVIPKTNTPATWLKPILVAEIDFQEWTNEGIMRQPVFLGLREDKDPKEVKIEKANNSVIPTDTTK